MKGTELILATVTGKLIEELINEKKMQAIKKVHFRFDRFDKVPVLK